MNDQDKNKDPGQSEVTTFTTLNASEDSAADDPDLLELPEAAPSFEGPHRPRTLSASTGDADILNSIYSDHTTAPEVVHAPAHPNRGPERIIL